MRAFFILIFLFGGLPVFGYPPAPPATIYGKVRGKFGFSPADGVNKLVLLADGEVVASAVLSEVGKFGKNYRMTLPDVDGGGNGRTFLPRQKLAASAKAIRTKLAEALAPGSLGADDLADDSLSSNKQDPP